ncbi:hypothetical protein A2914_01070 [Candidatus Nomurabacteria bacterium RIFCSPLOWO2_01_FULL_41_21]|uniref:Uncharacterized protein n=1 Tax=Candidatus Nomurabacteria bacterium RIFCSPLOWO2_01_FULL_41_21 TaxID=1801776 RepID=A0A1F6X1J6_9BACT|nr:MAG: hypothetical protein A2914_01070 [Candidatus Nomurabacteria bacterium RIFCSPLOWO2_01_FULL_41_21]
MRLLYGLYELEELSTCFLPPSSLLLSSVPTILIGTPIPSGVGASFLSFLLNLKLFYRYKNRRMRKRYAPASSLRNLNTS